MTEARTGEGKGGEERRGKESGEERSEARGGEGKRGEEGKGR